MNTKERFTHFLKRILSFRLVKINETFINKNKNISKSIHCIYDDENLWGQKISNPEDKNSDLYSLFHSRYNLVYFEANGKGFSFRSNHLSDSYGRYYYEDGVDYIPALSKFNFKKKIHLKGCCAYLSNTEPQHYGHFIMFVLPLLSFYETLCDKAPDYYYLGDINLNQFHYKLLHLAGISENKLITTPCTADKIVYASISQDYILKGKKYWDYDSYTYVRKLVSRYISTTGNRKIYVTRGNVRWRKLVNEDQLINFLIPLGFEIISMDNLLLEEQITIFSQAKIIIAGHGAALTNLLFCNEKTTVIEIFPYDYPDVTSYVIASYSHCNYYRSQGKKYDLKTKACYRNIMIDLDDIISKTKSIDTL